jgi:hypothetical protein
VEDWTDETETSRRGSLFWLIVAAILLIVRYLLKPFQ